MLRKHTDATFNTDQGNKLVTSLNFYVSINFGIIC